ncbi:hypothetical protein ACB092_01G009900 [Castanea dentata]
MLDWQRSITEWMGQGESLICSFMLDWLRSIAFISLNIKEWFVHCDLLFHAQLVYFLTEY